TAAPNRIARTLALSCSGTALTRQLPATASSRSTPPPRWGWLGRIETVAGRDSHSPTVGLSLGGLESAWCALNRLLRGRPRLLDLHVLDHPGRLQTQCAGEQRFDPNAHESAPRYRPVDMWTGSNAACPHAHSAPLPAAIVNVVFHTKRRGTFSITSMFALHLPAPLMSGNPIGMALFTAQSTILPSNS